MNYSSPIIYKTVISNNSSYGVYCYNYSSPSFTINESPGYNIIENNGFYGIQANYYCTPFLGYWNGYTLLGGYNSIINNKSYDIYAYNYSTVYADGTWWGTANPIYSVWNSGDSFIYNGHPLSSPPAVGNPNLLSNVSVNNEIISNYKTVINSKIEKAFEYQIKGNYTKAIELYENVIEEVPDSDIAMISLVRLEECYRKLKQTGFKNYLNNKIVSRKYSKHLIGVAFELQNKELLENGKYQEAIANYNILENDYSRLEGFRKNALFNKIYIYLKLMDDKENASNAFFTLSKEYPDDELTAISKLLMNEKSMNKEINFSINKAETNENSDKVFRLNQNYPNPFNPTTKIMYQLPKNDKVTIKVYDMLGKEVATVFSGVQSAGKHEVSFNASELASGVYIYKITTNNFTESKKMVLIK